MNKQVKRQKSFLIILTVITVFVFMLVSVDFGIFLLENQANPQINNLQDSFGAIETMFMIKGETGIYPITFAGRVLVLSFLAVTIILLIILIKQVLSIIRSGNLKENQVKLSVSETVDKQPQGIDKNTLVFEYEEDLIGKLEKLRQEDRQSVK